MMFFFLATTPVTHQLPVRWTAPEALEDRKFSEKTDAWSFGITLYEIWTKAALPYGEMNNQRAWVEVAHGLRLSKPEACSAEVYEAMTACWEKVQGQRPSMQQMAELLRRLYESHTGERAPTTQSRDSEYETPNLIRDSNFSAPSSTSVYEYLTTGDDAPAPISVLCSDCSGSKKNVYEYTSDEMMRHHETITSRLQSEASFMSKRSVNGHMACNMIRMQTQIPGESCGHDEASEVNTVHDQDASETIIDTLILHGDDLTPLDTDIARPVTIHDVNLAWEEEAKHSTAGHKRVELQ